ncbi:unnamed protein product [Kuraishia capsulata CBS 1993]|uniref:EH domain-containing and endocytosis protein 1 n=1 Tax=Kuraishia capsulata CBS 1993 TaxID=1382522 RepID=W6MUJ3_9ASCO|nr:uncharacterized protein KUCA_T00005315001 [Kuraishia capsulata CBS 1993]CDK29327.1 unnamed protein product [Kuraishia capsulata CBS 1993]
MRLIGHVQRGAPLSESLAHQSGPVPTFSGMAVNPTGGQTGPLGGGNLLGGTPTGSRVTSSASSIQHTGTGVASGGIVPPISTQALTNFSQMFDRASGGNGSVLTGDKAKDIFLKAKLPNVVLGQIWQLVDRDQRGELSKPEFIVAMHLIQCFLGKTLQTVPQVLAADIWRTAESSVPKVASPLASPPVVAPKQAPVYPQQTSNWQMSPAERKQFDQLFDQLDTAKQGKLSSNQVAQFLMGSGLPNEVLANIWELANINDSESFGKQEFAIALFLVGKKRSGVDLPVSVPVQLIQSVGTDSFAAPPKDAPAPIGQAPSQFPPAPQVQAAPKKENDFELLNDLFTGASISSAASPQRTASSHVTPQLTSSVTGSRAPFVPSSNFGQQMVSKEQQKQTPVLPAPTLLEESDDSEEEPASRVPPTIPGRDQKPRFDSPQTTGGPNYDALRSFSQQSTGTVKISSAPTAPISRQPTFPSTPAAPVSNEADREISSKLTQASVDIANFSNQINSLTNQTTQANEKREKANRELQRIMLVKQDIQSKLTKLRALYDREVQQIAEVESVLIQSRQDTEKLRQESSVAEASYHAEQAKLQKMQVEFEEIQKENQTMKERLGVLSAEKVESSSQLEKLTAQLKQAQSFLSVSQQQVATSQQEKDAITSKINDVYKAISEVEAKNAALLAKREQIQNETDELHSKHGDLSVEYSNKSLEYSSNAVSGTNHSSATRGIGSVTSSAGVGAAVGAGIAAVGAAVGGVLGHKAEQPTDYFNSKSIDPETEEPTAELESDDGFPIAENSYPTKQQIDESVPSVSVGSPSMTVGASTDGNDDTPNSSPTSSEDFELSHPNPSASSQRFNLPFARPESATSSVQNNAPLSVRGDLDVSMPTSPSSTIEEETASPSDVLASSAHTVEAYPEQESEQAQPVVSSGGESFEMVNADDAHESRAANHDGSPSTTEEEEDVNADTTPDVDSITKTAEDDFPEIQPTEAISAVMPGSLPGEFITEPSLAISKSVAEQSIPQVSRAEEFPPFEEKEVDESDSSDSDTSDDEFHDTVMPESPEKQPTGTTEAIPEVAATPVGFNPFSSTPTQPSQPDNFDQAFEGLETAPVGNDDFDDFDNLQEAAAENSYENREFDEHAQFDPQNFFAQQPQQTSGFDLDAQQQASEASAAQVNDEWEQIFAGFGNAPAGAPADPPAYQHASSERSTETAPVFGAGVTNTSTHAPSSQAHELAIEELVAMGFGREVSTDALQKNDWSIESASNYLIDNA